MHIVLHTMWKLCPHLPDTKVKYVSKVKLKGQSANEGLHRLQSSPGYLHVGHVPSKCTWQIPQTSSSGISHLHIATAFHFVILTFILYLSWECYEERFYACMEPWHSHHCCRLKSHEKMCMNFMMERELWFVYKCPLGAHAFSRAVPYRCILGAWLWCITLYLEWLHTTMPYHSLSFWQELRGRWHCGTLVTSVL